MPGLLKASAPLVVALLLAAPAAAQRGKGKSQPQPPPVAVPLYTEKEIRSGKCGTPPPEREAKAPDRPPQPNPDR